MWQLFASKKKKKVVEEQSQNVLVISCKCMTPLLDLRPLAREYTMCIVYYKEVNPPLRLIGSLWPVTSSSVKSDMVCFCSKGSILQSSCSGEIRRYHLCCDVRFNAMLCWIHLSCQKQSLFAFVRPPAVSPQLTSSWTQTDERGTSSSSTINDGAPLGRRHGSRLFHATTWTKRPGALSLLVLKCRKCRRMFLKSVSEWKEWNLKDTWFNSGQNRTDESAIFLSFQDEHALNFN